MLSMITLGAAARRVPRWLWAVIAAALLLLALFAMLDAYGDRRFREGHDQADREWVEAQNRLIAKAQKVSTEQDRKAVARAAEYAGQVEDEKAQIEATTKEGGSPMDILFKVQ